MRTLKRLLAAMLCVCLLAGSLVFSGAAADAKEPNPTQLSAPVVTVTKADGLTVSEVTFDFIPDDAQDAAGASPVFTDFDKDAVVNGSVILFSELCAFTGKPTAYDAQDGLLTVALFGKDGAAGVKMLNIAEELYADAKPYTADMNRLMNAEVGQILQYAFSFPQGLLKGSDAQSAAASFRTAGRDVQNIPVLKVELFGTKYYQGLDRLDAFANKIGLGDTSKWPGATVEKLVKLYVSATEDMVEGRNSFKAIVLMAAASILSAFSVPVLIPFAVRYFRAIQSAAHAFDPNWSLLKIFSK